MADQVSHSTIAVGQFKIVAEHPMVNPGVPCTLDKFKLDETLMETTQIIDNAIIVPLVDGSTITLTNTIKAGTLKFAAVRHSDNWRSGDIVAYANAMLDAGATVGATFTLYYFFNGERVSYLLENCCVKTCKQLTFAGNAINTHDVEFTYASIAKVPS